MFVTYARLVIHDYEYSRIMVGMVLVASFVLPAIHHLRIQFLGIRKQLRVKIVLRAKSRCCVFEPKVVQQVSVEM